MKSRAVLLTLVVTTFVLASCPTTEAVSLAKAMSVLKEWVQRYFPAIHPSHDGDSTHPALTDRDSTLPSLTDTTSLHNGTGNTTTTCTPGMLPLARPHDNPWTVVDSVFGNTLVFNLCDGLPEYVCNQAGVEGCVNNFLAVGATSSQTITRLGTGLNFAYSAFTINGTSATLKVDVICDLSAPRSPYNWTAQASSDGVNWSVTGFSSLSSVCWHGVPQPQPGCSLMGFDFTRLAQPAGQEYNGDVEGPNGTIGYDFNICQTLLACGTDYNSAALCLNGETSAVGPTHLSYDSDIDNLIVSWAVNNVYEPYLYISCGDSVIPENWQVTTGNNSNGFSLSSSSSLVCQLQHANCAVNGIVLSGLQNNGRGYFVVVKQWQKFQGQVGMAFNFCGGTNSRCPYGSAICLWTLRDKLSFGTASSQRIFQNADSSFVFRYSGGDNMTSAEIRVTCSSAITWTPNDAQSSSVLLVIDGTHPAACVNYRGTKYIVKQAHRKDSKDTSTPILSKRIISSISNTPFRPGPILKRRRNLVSWARKRRERAQLQSRSRRTATYSYTVYVDKAVADQSKPRSSGVLE